MECGEGTFAIKCPACKIKNKNLDPAIISAARDHVGITHSRKEKRIYSIGFRGEIRAKRLEN
jgi:hypothetical protein